MHPLFNHSTRRGSDVARVQEGCIDFFSVSLEASASIASKASAGNRNSPPRSNPVIVPRSTCSSELNSSRNHPEKTSSVTAGPSESTEASGGNAADPARKMAVIPLAAAEKINVPKIRKVEHDVGTDAGGDDNRASERIKLGGIPQLVCDIAVHGVLPDMLVAEGSLVALQAARLVAGKQGGKENGCSSAAVRGREGHGGKSVPATMQVR